MIQLPEHIRTAIAKHQPIVALESTVIAHGLPYPHNLEMAQTLEAEVRTNHATPATIGVVQGQPTVGMSTADIERFALAGTQTDQPHVSKLSRRDIAYAVARQHDGATTVAATMALAAMASIQVFATGGIGGVHRGARDTWDISADLTELARTPVLVVCAGAKSILDLPATLEYLETLGVPVVGFGTDAFPAFYSASSGLPVPSRADTPSDIATLWRTHQQFGGGSGMLVVVPPPTDVAIPEETIESAIEAALARATAAKIRGQQVTPFLLATVAEETEGESRHTNMALLRQNARVAAHIACALSST
ncbi:MAG: pseudouridine-5'-phosphate glycosidase [Chloroflexi bacterium AL-W]|nr:pseudouridine-5'-phosphate glycosidase [Chloroflexi bacterium AL-N1]NOK69480.1 pseudouridine-5'-phosphate glycosidase [Chloroflexi bacterium AL-N10]NOK77445.1 pseudouridine-5'-phosphate glycosidase [Chloroflexi bacterium AL-N5]NOK84296.1 pseudouridine-5'-phosphate glycosidase [Chloroflexi bacterium AL-W]NOK91538.1 pseudouridine-5'-phosphate glycosidase [Chloroflexi bacterium AL-N15]